MSHTHYVILYHGKAREAGRFPRFFGLSSIRASVRLRAVSVFGPGDFYILAYRIAAERRVICGMARKEDNLKKGAIYQFRTGEEQAKTAKAGGVASGIARRKKSTIKSLLKDWADSPISNAQLKRQAESFGLDTDEGKAVLTAAILKNALKGNSKYMEYALKLLGEDSAPDDVANDGFVDAFKATAADDWGDGDV